MEYKLSINEKSKDKRVAELVKLCQDKSFAHKMYFVEPRADLLEHLEDAKASARLDGKEDFPVDAGEGAVAGAVVAAQAGG